MKTHLLLAAALICAVNTAASTVGSINGSVQIEAGKTYRQSGSDVMTPQGNIEITAQTVDIESAEQRSRTRSDQKFEQTGIALTAQQTSGSKEARAGRTDGNKDLLDSERSSTLTGSSITSGQGSVELIALGNVSLDSSQVQAAQNALVLGRSVTAIAGHNTAESEGKTTATGSLFTTTKGQQESRTTVASQIQGGTGVQVLAMDANTGKPSGAVDLSGTNLKSSEGQITIGGESVRINAQVDSKTTSSQSQGIFGGNKTRDASSQETLAGGRIEAATGITIVAQTLEGTAAKELQRIQDAQEAAAAQNGDKTAQERQLKPNLTNTPTDTPRPDKKAAAAAAQAEAQNAATAAATATSTATSIATAATQGPASATAEATASDQAIAADGTGTIASAALNFRSPNAASASGQATGAQSSAAALLAKNASAALAAQPNTTHGKGDITLNGASLDAGAGRIVLDAEQDVNLGTIALQSRLESFRQSSSGGMFTSKTTTEQKRQVVQTEQGTSLKGMGLSINAQEGAITGKAVQADLAGKAQLQAKGDISILAGQTTTTAQLRTEEKSGFAGLQRSNTREQLDAVAKTAVSSDVGANTLIIDSKNNVRIQGSNVVADDLLSIKAKGHVIIEGAQESLESQSLFEKTTSGVMGGGGLSVMVGKREQTNTTTISQTSNAGSAVGSLTGSVDIQAGQQVKVSGSDVVAAGDMTVQGKTVTFEAAAEQTDSVETQKFKQSGLSVSVSGGMVSALDQAYRVGKTATGSGNTRVQALGGLQAAAKGYDAADIGRDMMNAGNMKDAAAASGIKRSVSVGSSSSESTTVASSTQHSASSALAGGKLTIKASEGDLNAVGSTLAARDVHLSASGNVNLESATDTASQHSKNSSSSASLGISVGMTSKGAGVTLDVAAMRGQGSADGTYQTQQNTTVAASNRLTIESGNDTNIRGAQVSGKEVSAKIGGDLNIESRQDSAQYDAKQSSSGFSASIPIYGNAAPSLSISSSNSKTNANYKGVVNQSGIFAGEGGFDIQVKGNTDLKGAVIDSKASPEQNNMSTGSLTQSDLKNTSQASSSTSGINLSSNMVQGKYEAAKGALGNAMDRGSAQQSDQSTARSGIAQGNLSITNEQQQQQRTGQSGAQAVTELNRDTADANRSLAKPDVVALQNAAQDQRAMNNLTTSTIFALTDASHTALFKKDAKMYRLPPGCSEARCAVEVSPEEAQRLQTSGDGNVHVANNGIYNNLNDAARLGQQNSGRVEPDGTVSYGIKPESLYLIYAPIASNPVSELLNAAYQNWLSPIFGLTNAEQANVNVINRYGPTGLVLDGHSRGTLTVNNAMGQVQGEGGSGTAPNLRVNFIGGAANASDANRTLQNITGNPNAQVNNVVHPDDLVGRDIGNNPANSPPGQTVGRDGRGTLSNAWNTMFGTDTPHNSYGSGRRVPEGEVSPSTVYWPNLTPSEAPRNVPTNPNGPARPPTGFDSAQEAQQQLRNNVGNAPLPSGGRPPVAGSTPTSATQNASDRAQQLRLLQQQIQEQAAKDAKKETEKEGEQK